MKVLLTKKFMPADIDYLVQRLDTGIELIEPSTYVESAVLEKIDGADVLLGGMLTPAILTAAKHIKLIQIPWTGVDNIDFDLLRGHQVAICNSHSNSMVVAEHALALLLSVAKKLPYHDAGMRLGKWNRVSPEGNPVTPFSAGVLNKKLVLVGYGAVNKWVHQLMSGFTPDVHIVTRSGTITGLPQAIAHNEKQPTLYPVAELDTALVDADFVVVAVPLTDKTRKLIGEDSFKAMGSTCIVVNVARGAIIDESALYQALSTQRIFGAGIDTWYNYPKPGEVASYPSSDVEFHTLNNLVMSPHRAGYVDSGFPHLDDAIVNINRAFAGQELLNRLAFNEGY